MGCIMMRKCHLNTCPVGIATQDPELRAKFAGKPEHVVNYFWLLAQEVREYMALMGFKSIEDMVGRADMLQVNESVLPAKARNLDLRPILRSAATLNPKAATRNISTQDHGLERALDQTLISEARDVLEGTSDNVVIDSSVNNLNRSVGAMLSYEVSTRFGEKGLPDDSIRVRLEGHAGQSFGFALAPGITLEVKGDANDYVGKGLSGGRIVVTPDEQLLKRTSDGEFDASENVIAGNTTMYGATAGEVFLRGKAGERFCVRNSGARTVVEGVGDHGCEYMTGGRVVVIGPTGRNFAAGMSGGIAYIWDPQGTFAERCNMAMVELETIEPASEDERCVQELLCSHEERTGSPRAGEVLREWDAKTRAEFVKVMPIDYRIALEKMQRDSEEDGAGGLEVGM